MPDLNDLDPTDKELARIFARIDRDLGLRSNLAARVVDLNNRQPAILNTSAPAKPSWGRWLVAIAGGLAWLAWVRFRGSWLRDG